MRERHAAHPSDSRAWRSVIAAKPRAIGCGLRTMRRCAGFSTRWCSAAAARAASAKVPRAYTAPTGLGRKRHVLLDGEEHLSVD